MRWLLLLLGLFMITIVSEVQGADLCKGSLAETHRIGIYDFVTNSDIGTFGNHNRFKTCIQNIGKNDLWINWFVPGPRSWVPPDEIAEMSRFAIDAHSPSLVSCIEYGNLAEKTLASFFGSEDDATKVDIEKTIGCHTTDSVRTTKDKGSFLDKLYAPLKLFFPSDRSRPRETMLQLEGDVYLERIAATPFESRFENSFQFTVGRYKGREDGKPSDVRLRPMFVGEVKDLMANFRQFNKSPLVRLSEKGDVRFSYVVPGSAIVTNARYEFIDEADRIVASFDFPVAITGPEK